MKKFMMFSLLSFAFVAAASEPAQTQAPVTLEALETEYAKCIEAKGSENCIETQNLINGLRAQMTTTQATTSTPVAAEMPAAPTVVLDAPAAQEINAPAMSEAVLPEAPKA